MLHFQIILFSTKIFYRSLIHRRNSPAAKIFDGIAGKDFKHSPVVTKTAKRLAWACVIFINIYFVYFSVLRGITRSRSWQMDYLFACICQFLVEVFFNETLECVWIQYVIPKMVSDDIATTISTVKHSLTLAFRDMKVQPILDSPKYFFVSRRVAEKYPMLFESAIVMSFQSYFPPAEADDVITNKKLKNLNAGEVLVVKERKSSSLMTWLRRFSFYAFFLSALQRLGTIPLRSQEVIIHTLQPILLSFLIILYLYLLQYPIVGFVILAFICYELIHYFWGKQKEMKKNIPAINDVEKNDNKMEEIVSWNSMKNNMINNNNKDDNNNVMEKTRNEFSCFDSNLHHDDNDNDLHNGNNSSDDFVESSEEEGEGEGEGEGYIMNSRGRRSRENNTEEKFLNCHNNDNNNFNISDYEKQIISHDIHPSASDDFERKSQTSEMQDGGDSLYKKIKMTEMDLNHVDYTLKVFLINIGLNKVVLFWMRIQTNLDITIVKK